MDLVAWASFAAAAALALAVVTYLYRRRETPVRGRWFLAALRWLTLALLILLAFDPDMPAPGFAAGAGRTRVLLDASLSMGMPSGEAGGRSRWTDAVDQVRGIAGGRDVILFGETPAALPADSLAARSPSATGSRLLPAVRVASEAGARRVVVVTDGAIEDADDAARAASALAIDLDVRTVGGGDASNVALAEIAAPAWAEAGEAIDVRVGVTAVGGRRDSVEVELRHEGRLVARTRVAAPEPGRVAPATLRVTPEAPGEEGGLVRYDARVSVDDAADEDDRRSVYVRVSDRPAGVVLLSFRPDWEPRFLEPTLERSLGMPVQGYLRLAPDRYLAMGAGGEADVTGSVSQAEVRRAAGRADLVVLHGLGDDAPAWARELAGSAPRVLVFPADDASGVDLPIRLPPRSGGEWYAAGRIPSSPVASLLASLEVDDLPPLTGVRPASPGADGWSPLDLRRGRRGVRAPVLLAGADGDRRWAVALADGYWRWAFRGGAGRQVYRRLWSAVGGWLIEDRRGATVAAIRPVDRVVARGEPVRWVAPGLDADSVSFRIAAVGTEGDSAAPAAAAANVAVSPRGDTLATPTLSPGHYRYRARAYADGEEIAVADGPLTVSSYSPEFSRPRVGLGGAGAPRGSPGFADLAGAGGRPLHTTPWPYALLLLALCTEWALRRRWGLR